VTDSVTAIPAVCWCGLY